MISFIFLLKLTFSKTIYNFTRVKFRLRDGKGKKIKLWLRNWVLCRRRRHAISFIFKPKFLFFLSLLVLARGGIWQREEGMGLRINPLIQSLRGYESNDLGFICKFSFIFLSEGGGILGKRGRQALYVLCSSTHEAIDLPLCLSLDHKFSFNLDFILMFWVQMRVHNWSSSILDDKWFLNVRSQRICNVHVQKTNLKRTALCWSTIDL